MEVRYLTEEAVLLIDEYLERIRCASPFLEGTDDALPEVYEIDGWWCLNAVNQMLGDLENVTIFASKEDAECWSDGYNCGLQDTPRRIDAVCYEEVRSRFEDGVVVRMFDKTRALVVLRKDQWVPCTALGAPAWVGRKKFEQIVADHGENRTAQYFNCASFEEAKARWEAYELLGRLRSCNGNTLPIAIEMPDLSSKIEAALSVLGMTMTVNDVLTMRSNTRTSPARRPRDNVDVSDLVTIRRVA